MENNGAKRSMALKTKLIIANIILVLIAVILVGLLSLNVSKGVLTDQAKDDMQAEAGIMAEKIDQKLADNLQLMQTIASDSIFTDADATVEEKSIYASTKGQAAGFYSCLYVSKTGHVVLPDIGFEFDIDTGDEAFTRALDGTTSYRNDRTMNDTDLMATAATPILDAAGNVSAVLVATTSIDAFGDLLNDETEAFIVDVNGDYIGSTRAAAFVTDENGDPVASDDGTLQINEDDPDNPINLSISPIAEAESDQSYAGLAALIQDALANCNGTEEYTSMLTGNEQFAAYAQVETTGWEVCYLVDQESVLSGVNSITGKIMLIAVILMICAGILTFLISKVLFVPLTRATENLSEIVDGIRRGEGDLTKRIPVTSNDEIGAIARGINGYTEVLQNVTQKIKEQMEDLGISVGKIEGSVSQSNEQAADNSAIMQELTSSMEQVNSNTTTINEGLGGFRERIRAVSEETENGKELAASINEQALSIRENSIRNQENTRSMLEKITGSLNESIEKSSSVNRIGELTGNIQDIASQTNLLSLNASIEAARAGEAGKGFAVVADEISTLAASTADTASSINEISEGVTEAVGELVKNTRDLLSYINTSVLADYEGMVKTGEDYSSAAEKINDMMINLQGAHSEMLTDVEGFTDMIASIAGSVDECTRGINEAARNTGSLVDSFENITGEVNVNRGVTDELGRELGKFKKL